MSRTKAFRREEAESELRLSSSVFDARKTLARKLCVQRILMQGRSLSYCNIVKMSGRSVLGAVHPCAGSSPTSRTASAGRRRKLSAILSCPAVKARLRLKTETRATWLARAANEFRGEAIRHPTWVVVYYP